MHPHDLNEVQQGQVQGIALGTISDVYRLGELIERSNVKDLGALEDKNLDTSQQYTLTDWKTNRSWTA